MQDLSGLPLLPPFPSWLRVKWQQALLSGPGANSEQRASERRPGQAAPCPWRTTHGSWNKLVLASLTCLLCWNAREKEEREGGRERERKSPHLSSPKASMTGQRGSGFAVHQGLLSRPILWVVPGKKKGGLQLRDRLEGSMRMNQSLGISPAFISRLLFFLPRSHQNKKKKTWLNWNMWLTQHFPAPCSSWKEKKVHIKSELAQNFPDFLIKKNRLSTCLEKAFLAKISYFQGERREECWPVYSCRFITAVPVVWTWTFPPFLLWNKQCHRSV